MRFQLAKRWLDALAGVRAEQRASDFGSIETVRWTESWNGSEVEAKYLDKGKALHYNASQAITG